MNADSDRANAEKLAAEAELRLRERNVSTLAATDVLAHMLSNTTFNSQQQVNASQRGTTRATSRAARSVADMQSIQEDQADEPYEQPTVTLTPNQHSTSHSSAITPAAKNNTGGSLAGVNGTASTLEPYPVEPSALTTTPEQLPITETVTGDAAQTDAVVAETTNNAANTADTAPQPPSDSQLHESQVAVADLPAKFDPQPHSEPVNKVGLGQGYNYNDLSENKQVPIYTQHQQVVDLP